MNYWHSIGRVKNFHFIIPSSYRHREISTAMKMISFSLLSAFNKRWAIVHVDMKSSPLFTRLFSTWSSILHHLYTTFSFSDLLSRTFNIYISYLFSHRCWLNVCTDQICLFSLSYSHSIVFVHLDHLSKSSQSNTSIFSIVILFRVVSVPLHWVGKKKKKKKKKKWCIQLTWRAMVIYFK